MTFRSCTPRRAALALIGCLCLFFISVVSTSAPPPGRHGPAAHAVLAVSMPAPVSVAVDVTCADPMPDIVRGVYDSNSFLYTGDVRSRPRSGHVYSYSELTGRFHETDGGCTSSETNELRST